MQTVKLEIPFIYRAQIIKPRCRKPVEIMVSDKMEVEILCVAGGVAPVAFVTSKIETLLFNECLWSRSFHSATDMEPVVATLDAVVSNTNDPSDYKWSSSSPVAPFFNVWHGIKAQWDGNSWGTPCPWLKDDCVLPLSDHIYRELVSDNRNEVMMKITDVAKDMLSVDGIIHRPVREPMYAVVCFGLGNNHGGTGMFVSTGYNRNIPHRCYFRADQRKEAIAYATKVATERGDTQSLQFESKVPMIEVLIPEAVTANPEKDHPVT